MNPQPGAALFLRNCGAEIAVLDWTATCRWGGLALQQRQQLESIKWANMDNGSSRCGAMRPRSIGFKMLASRRLGRRRIGGEDGRRSRVSHPSETQRRFEIREPRKSGGVAFK